MKASAKNKVDMFMARATKVAASCGPETEEDILAAKEARREQLELDKAREQKNFEDRCVDTVRRFIESGNLAAATEKVMEYLEACYGPEAVATWSLKYYKRLTKNNDITPFDKVTTSLLRARGDIK